MDYIRGLEDMLQKVILKVEALLEEFKHMEDDIKKRKVGDLEYRLK